MTVHNHGPREGRGLDCGEVRQPDGSLKGHCMNADLPPSLPDTSGWVRRVPGDVIEAGTPYAYRRAEDGEEAVITSGVTYDFTLDDLHPEDAYWTPPPVEPAPWERISVDAERPTDAYVNGVPGRWFRDSDYLIAINPSGGRRTCGELDQVTHVELLHTCPETHVPVERALIERVVVAGGDAALADLDELAALADGGKP